MQNPSWLKTLWQRLFVIVQLMSYGIISMAGWYQKRLEMSTSQLSCKLLSTHTLLFAWTRLMKPFEPFGTHQVPMTNTHLPTYLTTVSILHLQTHFISPPLSPSSITPISILISPIFLSHHPIYSSLHAHYSFIPMHFATWSLYLPCPYLIPPTQILIKPSH